MVQVFLWFKNNYHNLETGFNTNQTYTERWYNMLCLVTENEMMHSDLSQKSNWFGEKFEPCNIPVQCNKYVVLLCTYPVTQTCQKLSHCAHELKCV